MAEYDPNLVVNTRQIPDNVRLVDLDNNTYVATRARVVERIQETQLDLYCVNADSSPPVYKLLDYGRFRYDQQKRKREQNKKAREQNRSVKEFKFKPQIDSHDVEVKIHHIQENLPDCDVKICMDLKRNAFVLTNRWSRTIPDVVNDPAFVLNRVIVSLKELIQPARLTITENMVYAMLRYQQPDGE